MLEFLSPIMTDYTNLIELLDIKVVQLNSAELDKQGKHIRNLLNNLLLNIQELKFKKIKSQIKLEIDLETLVLALFTSNAGGIIKQLSQVYPRTNENLLLERKVILSEQLGLIGDAALQAAFHTHISELPYDEVAILSKTLVKRSINTIEGTYTELSKNLVSNDNLEKLWNSWKIEQLLGECLKPNSATHSRATVVEAIIGALFLQNKFRIIVNLIPKWINLIKQKK